MLHPFPENDRDPKNGITESVLIHFDLSGIADEDVYPPGYNKLVMDCSSIGRSGEASKTMKKSDDWKALGAVMTLYSTKDHAYNKKWNKIAVAIDSGQENPCELLSDFTNQIDHEIKIDRLVKNELDQIACTGTGSPTKDLQKPRGSLSVIGHP